MTVEINVAPLEGILNNFVARMDEIQSKLAVSESEGETPEPDPNTEPDNVEPEGVSENQDETETKQEEQSPMTIQEFVASASPEHQAVLNEGLALLEKQKSELVEKVFANSKEVYSKEELAGMTVNELQKLDKLVSIAPKEEPATDYSVNGAKVVDINSTDTKAYTPEKWEV